ncbi:protein of unknown function [Streptomyces murinus]
MQAADDLRDDERRAPLHAGAPAYVIFTSGSTGRPRVWWSSTGRSSICWRGRIAGSSSDSWRGSWRRRR